MNEKYNKFELYFLSCPVSMYDDLLLVYDFSYKAPLKQYKISRRSRGAITRLLHGNISRIQSDVVRSMSDMGLVKNIQVRGILPSKKTLLVADSSIGGPSLWGKWLSQRYVLSGYNAIFVSYSRKEILVNGVSLPLPNPWNKFIFSHLARAFASRLLPEKLMIIGWDAAARMWDFLKNRDSVIVETGFGEHAIHNYNFSDANLLQDAFAEVLFRTDIYPWDSLACAISTAAALRSARLNLVWSERLFSDLKNRQRLENVVFNPPCIDLFPRGSLPDFSRQKIRILAGTGAHKLDLQRMGFLSLDKLSSVSQKLKDVDLTLLSANPRQLTRDLGLAPQAKVLFGKSNKEVRELLSNYNIFFRVQNDPSIPISCIEAMNVGLVVIMNAAAKQTFRELKHMGNCVLVPFGDEQFLTKILKELLANRRRMAQIAESARRMTSKLCATDSCLKKIKWLGE